MGWWSALGRHDAHGCHCSRAVVFLPLRSVPFSRLPPLLGSGIALDQWYPKRVKELPRKTRRSWDEPGHAHFLTWSCYRRLPLLTAERTRRWVVEAMDEVRGGIPTGDPQQRLGCAANHPRFTASRSRATKYDSSMETNATDGPKARSRAWQGVIGRILESADRGWRYWVEA